MKKKQHDSTQTLLLLANPWQSVTSASYHSNYKPTTHIHCNRHFEILVVKKGSGSHYIDFEDVPVTNNQVFFLRPGQWHQFSPSPDAEFYFLAIDPNKMAQTSRLAIDRFDFFQSFSIAKSCCFQSVESLIKSITAIENEMHINHAHKRYQESLISSYMLVFLIHLQRLWATQFTPYSPLLRQFNYYLTEAAAIRRRFVKEYAHLLAVTPNYLNECVRKETGYAASYWIRARVQLAIKKALLADNLSVAELAMHFGFASDTHFIRFFKTYEDCTPHAFRKRFKDVQASIRKDAVWSS